MYAIAFGYLILLAIHIAIILAGILVFAMCMARTFTPPFSKKEINLAYTTFIPAACFALIAIDMFLLTESRYIFDDFSKFYYRIFLLSALVSSIAGAVNALKLTDKSRTYWVNTWMNVFFVIIYTFIFIMAMCREPAAYPDYTTTLAIQNIYYS